NHDFAHKPFPLSFKKDSCGSQRIVITASFVYHYPGKREAVSMREAPSPQRRQVQRLLFDNLDVHM
ncbi:MAG: hypothetical protein AAB308_06670, partial [Nitrospirota bacterium]